MKEKYCATCKTMAMATGHKTPLCEADVFLATQADSLVEKRDLVHNYPEWVGNFIRFLAKIRIKYNGCPNKSFKKNLYSAERDIGKTKN